MVSGSAATVLAHTTYDNMYPTAYYTTWYCGGSNACRADGTSHSVYFEGTWSHGLRVQTINRMNHFTSVTDLVVWETSSPVYSAGNNGETDVIVQNKAIPGLDGRVYCEDVDDYWGTVCDQHYMELDEQAMVGWTKHEKRRVTCHELGHTVGLKHGSAAENTGSGSSQPGSDDDSVLGCLHNPAFDGPNFLGAHNVHQINNHY